MYTLNLESVTKTTKEVGGKGANLGEMIQAGLPVPPGFVVTIDSYEKFIKDNNLGEKINEIIQNIDTDNPDQLEKASKDIEELIVNANMPDVINTAIKNQYEEMALGSEIKKLSGMALDFIKAGRETFVAVRSSATAEDLADASFAGQMKSFMNIRGISDLVTTVKKCWASLYTPRAIFYRKTKRITQNVSIAVIVQKMVDSEKAGVIFTADPTTNDKSKVIIEALWGLGESVVSGSVNPDEYFVEKATGNILDIRVKKKLSMRKRDSYTGRTIKEKVPNDMVSRQVLNEAEIKKLWELSVKLEKHYNDQPQDIEWCEERNRIFLTQTRPITTIDKQIAVEEYTGARGKELLRGESASSGIAKGIVRIVQTLDDLPKVEQGNILVTRMTTPDMVSYMKKAAAIITDEGGRTAHAAIVSRELGLPCIVGTENATSILKDGQEVTVDAREGVIYSDKMELEELPKVNPPETERHESDSEDIMTATEIKVNIAFPETADSVADKAEGVGLLRAEHMLTESNIHPVHMAKNDPEELIRIIVEDVGKIAKAFYPKPVWYRTLDARTDEFKNLEGADEEPQEANPMIGWHGIRRSIDEPDVLRCELEAIKQLHEDGLNNILIMFPFVIDVSELKRVKEFIHFPVKIGIMVETPAAALKIEDFCKEGIEFVSFGSNDLTQLVLGIDRGNSMISKLYDEMNPAVLKLMENVIKTCKKYDVKTSICGEAASNPAMAEKLIRFGIDSLSVQKDAIDHIRSLTARIERKILLGKVRE